MGLNPTISRQCAPNLSHSICKEVHALAVSAVDCTFAVCHKNVLLALVASRVVKYFGIIGLFFDCFILLASTYKLEIVVDVLGLLVPLEPRHELGVKSPRHLLERLSGHVLSHRAFHVVEDEKERLC